MSWTIAGKYVRAAATDPDAQAYLQAVEDADGQSLEFEVARAIDNFVLGCKADGIWNAIKASCILAGARTRLGALTPLVGTAPTSFNFVDADYNRKTGLVGNGSTKYLGTGYLDSSQTRTNRHRCVFATTKASLSGPESRYYMGNVHNSGSTFINSESATSVRLRTPDSGSAVSVSRHENGFIGFTRNSDLLFGYRNSGITSFHAPASLNGPNATAINIFCSGEVARFVDARLAFYSIGESLDLALLDARVTDLINAFDTAIPS